MSMSLERGLRTFKEHLSARFLQDLAFTDKDHLIGEASRLSHVMCRHNDAHALRALFQQVRGGRQQHCDNGKRADPISKR